MTCGCSESGMMSGMSGGARVKATAKVVKSKTVKSKTTTAKKAVKAVKAVKATKATKPSLTKAEWYAKASALDVKGRSKMNKGQLEKACASCSK